MRRVLVLRPEPGATATSKRARRYGLNPVAIPLFEIVPLAWDAPDPGGFDALLLTSANAVRCGGDGLQSLRGLPVHAVGEATAAAARDSGFDIASHGDSNVDRLLSSIEGDIKLLHLCGEHRTAIAEPRQTITAIPVYRAQERDISLARDEVQGAIALIHSQRAASRFATLVDEANADRASIAVAAISPDVAAAAGDGWAAIEAAGTPTDEALLALAAQLCKKPVQT